MAGAVAFASDPNVGTWKLNEAKSKIPAMAPWPVIAHELAYEMNPRATVYGSFDQAGGDWFLCSSLRAFSSADESAISVHMQQVRRD
jgi:hypothetical protein